MNIKTESEKETKNLAKKIAKSINKNKDRATVLLLKGELGSGKTTFTKGFANEFGIDDITSPTFVIMKKYKLENNKFDRLYHIDCYRIEEKTNLNELNFDKLLTDKDNIILIEWPERLINIPEKTLQINFKVLKNNKREVKIQGEGLKN
ncbi:MAG: tRNA (adenosine(37)-N6)-threonylcarbamoyltransferase complex ATPase subunit type 1 TsaE [Patescibacteria group bacterium]